ncbi:O69 family O-antigen polymerase, partial [Escherichia coli]|nr:O69 family O-antigen polymerase [Escherichia coli]
YFNNTVSSLYIILLSITAIVTSSKNNKCFYFLMLLFSFTSLDLMFNAYRQAFAFIFIYNSLFLFLREKKIKGALLAVISFGFHWSAVILILFYFLSRFLKNKYSYLILLLLFPFVLISMFYPLGLMGIGYNVLLFLPLNELFKAHVLAYLEVDNISSASFYILNLFGRLPLAISVLTFYAFILIFYKKIRMKRIIAMIVLMAVYCLVFMEMAYSFRNYYWVLPFFPIIALDYAESNQAKIHSRMIGIAALHILIALPTFYSSGINSMIFNTGN